jgi:hypothetical protein
LNLALIERARAGNFIDSYHVNKGKIQMPIQRERKRERERERERQRQRQRQT